MFRTGKRAVSFLEAYRDSDSFLVRRYLLRANGTNPYALSDSSISSIESLVGGPIVTSGLPIFSDTYESDLAFYRALLRDRESFESLGRLPSRFESLFLLEQLRLNRKKELPEYRARAIERYLPDWNRESGTSVFGEKAKYVLALKESLGRFPTEEEDIWLFLQRRAYRKGDLDPGKEEVLDRVLPGWKEIKSVPLVAG